MEALQVGIFGPLDSHLQQAKLEEDSAAASGDLEASRKRIQHQLSNGSPAKRPRLSNGHGDAAAAATPVVVAGAPAAPAATSTDAETAAAAGSAATTTTTANTTNTTNTTTATTTTITSTTPTAAATALNANGISAGPGIDNHISNNDHNNPFRPASAPTPMDVDPTHDTSHPHESHLDSSSNQAYPSPLEGEPLPVLPMNIRTDGPEQGTQVDKVEELSPDTTFIRLMDDGGGSVPEATATPSPSPASAENAPVLLQCEWNPRDSSVLAAAGTDALARVWTISRAAPPELNHVSPRAHTLLDPETPRTTTVTALSWTSDGATIAVATDMGSFAAVGVWSADGIHMHSLQIPEPPVIKLSWNPSNLALLAISPEKAGALVTVYSAVTGTVCTHPLPGHDIATTPLDATWTSDAELLLTGGELLLSLRCTESSLVPVRRFDTREDDSFSQVLFDWRSRLAATSSDKGILDVGFFFVWHADARCRLAIRFTD